MSGPPLTRCFATRGISATTLLQNNAQLAQKGMQLHTPALIEQHAAAIYQQAVQQRVMPLNNATQMTDDERALLARWFEAGRR